MKIVLLDGKSIGDDIDLSKYDKFGEFIRYDYTTYDEATTRTKDADVVIVNKTLINEHTIGGAENLKLVCVTATGINNLDTDYLKKRGIEYRNVSAYSTDAVAQHTFALLFYLLEKMRYYDDYVRTGRYIEDKQFTHFENAFDELASLTFGVIGLGNIGRRVYDIASAFGARCVYYSTSGKNIQEGYERVSFNELLSTCDIISVHAPLNKETEGLMDYAAFSKMKRSAIFLNLGRGAIVNEADLVRAIKEGLIAGAGLDVISKEPMTKDSPFREILGDDRLVITPHIAWAPRQTRERLMDILYGKIEEYFNG